MSDDDHTTDSIIARSLEKVQQGGLGLCAGQKVQGASYRWSKCMTPPPIELSAQLLAALIERI